MAGDWIKMRGNLWDDPRVGRLAELTDAGEAAVIGGLYWLWAMADQHSEDGFLAEMTLKTIDRKTGVPTLGAALATIKWVTEEEGGLRIARFEEHNGASAKRRCSDAQRKANGRKVSADDADNMPTDSGHEEDELRRLAELEKEKRREEIDTSEQRKEKPAKRASPQPCPEDVAPQVWDDWLSLRKGKRAQVTATTVEEARSEAGKARISFEAFLRVWCVRGSQGLQADWLTPAERAGPASETAYQRSMRERMAGFAPGAVAKAPGHVAAPSQLFTTAADGVLEIPQ